MKRFFASLVIMMAVLTVGCSRTKQIPLNEVHMGSASFVQTTATVSTGQPVKFITDADGATHILVVGQNGVHVATPNAPAVLNSDGGATVNPGQEVDVTFPQAGTYTITCKIHPSMLMTVTVNP